MVSGDWLLVVGCVFQAGCDVFTNQARIISENFLFIPALSQ